MIFKLIFLLYLFHAVNDVIDSVVCQVEKIANFAIGIITDVKAMLSSIGGAALQIMEIWEKGTELFEAGVDLFKQNLNLTGLMSLFLNLSMLQLGRRRGSVSERWPSLK